MYLWHLLAYQIWAFQSIEVFDKFWTLCARASSVSVPAYAVCSIPTNKLQRAHDRRPSARPCTWWGSATSRLLPREIWGPLISSVPSSTSHVFRHHFQLDYTVAEKYRVRISRIESVPSNQFSRDRVPQQVAFVSPAFERRQLTVAKARCLVLKSSGPLQLTVARCS